MPVSLNRSPCTSGSARISLTMGRRLELLGRRNSNGPEKEIAVSALFGDTHLALIFQGKPKGSRCKEGWIPRCEIHHVFRGEQRFQMLGFFHPAVLWNIPSLAPSCFVFDMKLMREQDRGHLTAYCSANTGSEPPLK